MPKGIYIGNKGKKLSEETRKKMSEARMGEKNHMWKKHHSEETKKKVSEAKKKNPVRYWLGKKRDNMSNENNINWIGDNVSYGALHSWVSRHLGKPRKCEFCGKDGLIGKQIHWANIGHLYKRNLTDWIRLCRKCHEGYDIQLNLQ